MTGTGTEDSDLWIVDIASLLEHKPEMPKYRCSADVRVGDFCRYNPEGTHEKVQVSPSTIRRLEGWQKRQLEAAEKAVRPSVLDSGETKELNLRLEKFPVMGHHHGTVILPAWLVLVGLALGVVLVIAAFVLGKWMF